MSENLNARPARRAARALVWALAAADDVESRDICGIRAIIVDDGNAVLNVLAAAGEATAALKAAKAAERKAAITYDRYCVTGPDEAVCYSGVDYDRCRGDVDALERALKEFEEWREAWNA